MKAKVTRRFSDKYTGAIYNKGDILDLTEERFSEIMGVGNFLFRIAQNDVQNNSSENMNSLSDDTAETLTGDSAKSGDGFDIMSVRELKEYADKTYKLTFKAGTKKAEMIEMLRNMEHK